MDVLETPLATVFAKPSPQFWGVTVKSDGPGFCGPGIVQTYVPRFGLYNGAAIFQSVKSA